MAKNMTTPWILPLYTGYRAGNESREWISWGDGVPIQKRISIFYLCNSLQTLCKFHTLIRCDFSHISRSNRSNMSPLAISTTMFLHLQMLSCCIWTIPQCQHVMYQYLYCLFNDEFLLLFPKLLYLQTSSNILDLITSDAWLYILNDM